MLAVLTVSDVVAKITLPPIISSNMVLQQGRSCPVWGWADPGETLLVVTFAGQSHRVKTDAIGRWAVDLSPMKADKTPRTLTVRGRRDTVTLTNIVVGEVWICGGQSNMQYSLRRFKTFKTPRRGADLGAEELKKPANAMIRVFLSDRAHSWRSWQVASGESIPDITAAGYFFGKTIQNELDVPVGIVSAALGGQRIETWTDVDAYRTSEIFGTRFLRTPKIGGIEPGQWYNHLIVPLAPLAARGFLWYQGENNCVEKERHYAEKYELLVDCWRHTFRVPDAPFYAVLLAPYRYSAKKGKRLSAEELPLFWQQQLDGVSRVANNDIVCISDLVDDLSDIHPPYKWEVGERLARLALAKTYGRHVGTATGPHLKGVERKQNKLLLTFDNAGRGLRSRDNRPLDWFEVAGKDGRFHAAKAKLEKSNVVALTCDSVPHPLAVRFAWNECAMPNLVNSDGLPAFPFRAINVYKKPKEQ